MIPPPITVTCLRHLIGCRVQYQGIPCRIIEVLEEGPILVLQEAVCHQAIQPDQFGKARRRAPQTLEVNVQDSSGRISPAFLALGVLPLLSSP
ncbi:hypothetical protein [Nitrosococcus watsonii]|uniref:Uncharacterized protein n=1 Tax=Nitrosococcus watsoni (strain C-113) TaxID=105559 RepID=D8K907_NITWC|nr:hypothetical protein [Nitrosococcus watsonii]ADJ27217.1 conserved hypothetical protein [Nitrosococcus watsonii C-113]